MSNSSQFMKSRLRNISKSGNSVSSGKSSVLVARINEKRAELENLKQLRDLSAELTEQMLILEEKLATLNDGTEAVATVLGNWNNVLQAISMASQTRFFLSFVKMLRVTRSQASTKDKTIIAKPPTQKAPAQTHVRKSDSVLCGNQIRSHKVNISKEDGSKNSLVKTVKGKNLKSNKSNEINHNRSQNNLEAESKVESNKDKVREGHITCLHAGKLQIRFADDQLNLDKKRLHPSLMAKKPAGNRSSIDKTRHSSETQSSLASPTLKKQNHLPIIRISSDDNVIKNDDSNVSLVNDDEDSFLQYVTSRSPVKPITRIENSFETLDQLEKVFEVFQEISKFEKMLEQDSPKKSNTKVAFDTRSIRLRKPSQANKDLESCLREKTRSSFKNTSDLSLKLEKFKSSTEVKINSKSSDLKKQNLSNNSSNKPSRRSLIEPPAGTLIVPSGNSNSQHRSVKNIPRQADVPIPTSSGVKSAGKSHLGSFKDVRQKTDLPVPAVNGFKSAIRSSISKSRDDVFTRLSTATSKYHRRDSHQCDGVKSKDTKSILTHNKSISTLPKSPDSSRSTCLNFKEGYRGGHRALKARSSQPCLKNLNISSPGVYVNLQNHPNNSNRGECELHPPNLKPVIRDIKKPHSSNSSGLKGNKANEFMNSALLARFEAAERGRQTINDWAKKKMANRTIAATA